MIEIKSWKVDQAINMFNSLNSDGLPLYDSDIISAQLYAAAAKEGKRDEFRLKWEELYDCSYKLQEKGIGSIDSILMQQMYYLRAIRGETLTASGTVNVTTPGLKRYFTENKGLLNQPVSLCNNMINLAKIWDKITEYPVSQVLFKFNENSKLFLASYFYRFKEVDISEDRVKVILECMLRLFAILELVDIGYSSSSFKTFLFSEQLKLVDNAIGVDVIKSDFDAHINGRWDKDAIISELMEYDKNTLVYLNEYLFAKESNRTFALGAKYDIEHIMPYSGNNLQEIRRDAEIDSEEEFAGFVNKLGNKIVLEERINRSIGNEWFRTKISTKLNNKTGYIDSQYPIAGALVERYIDEIKPYWKKDDIKKATEKASRRIADFIFGK